MPPLATDRCPLLSNSKAVAGWGVILLWPRGLALGMPADVAHHRAGGIDLGDVAMAGF